MAGKVSPTLKVLIEIRNELRGTNRRVDALGERVDALGERVDALEQTMRAVAPAVMETLTLLRARSDLGDRVMDHERRLVALERRTG